MEILIWAIISLLQIVFVSYGAHRYKRRLNKEKKEYARYVLETYREGVRRISYLDHYSHGTWQSYRDMYKDISTLLSRLPVEKNDHVTKKHVEKTLDSLNRHYRTTEISFKEVFNVVEYIEEKFARNITWYEKNKH